MIPLVPIKYFNIKYVDKKITFTIKITSLKISLKILLITCAWPKLMMDYHQPLFVEKFLPRHHFVV